MSRWYVAPALDALRAEVDARWPGRDRSSDGAIGDPSHQARKSDHNPDWSAGGVVRARDFDVDGIDVNALTAALLADDRTRYVIYDRRIATRVPGGFRWDPYTGVNPHTGHLHVSVRGGRYYENDTSPWDLGGEDWFTMATIDELRAVVREEIANAEASRRVLKYVDAKTSETLAVARRVETRTKPYLDAKVSEVLDVARQTRDAVTAAAPEDPEDEPDELGDHTAQINPDHPLAGGTA
ncbi:hypothetical protein CBR64_20870 [Cellulosimicrobium cellulans]|uniref:Uncharacterized protein n=1 Tax=Cellulosimicrobium cellulans TaxID=1710 RepID=A0A1Y0HRI2_CELCE|nr:hypothetical protein [Cellulosimicrobium cellulans]ARU50146.1 hypothetical protein CBR64_00065 [Cellulosimicrobium cellulans]ARU53512.1 hypothetical protein CBR64_20870 [Cellulosimicrobium cellulans]